MQDNLAELIPVAAGVLVPKGKDPNEPWTLLGYGSEEVNQFAFNSLTRRLKAIGVPLSGAQARSLVGRAPLHPVSRESRSLG